MQILKEPGIDWCERRFISKLYMDYSVKVDWTKWRQDMWRLGEELDKDAVCHWFYSTYIANTLPRKLSKGLEISKLEDK
jgi:hypothetical protein